MNLSNKIGLCTVVALLVNSSFAVAADTAKATKAVEAKPIPANIVELSKHLMSEKEFDAYTDKIIKVRNLAEVDLGANAAQDNYSDKMKKFEAAFLAARTGEDINKLFTQLDKEYNKEFALSDDFNNPKYRDYRYFGSRVLPFRKMAGYVWRMVKVVEDGKIRASQEVLLSMIRSMAEEIKIHAPNSHNEAIFRFLTEPQEGYLTQFKSETEVQDFYINELAPEIATSISRIIPIDLTSPIVYDARLRFGDVSFPDSSEKRFRRVGEAEKASVLARMYRRLAAINIMTAYDFSGYLKMRHDMGQEQGIDVMFSKKIGGLTREERTRIMAKNKNFGAIRPNGAAQMKIAYAFMAMDVRYMISAHEKLKKESDTGDWLLEPEVLLSRKEIDDHSLRTLRALTRPALDESAPAVVKLTSSLTGVEERKGSRAVSAPDTFVNVNMKAYFNNPPQNLQELMPTDFDHGAEYKQDKTYCPSCRYRNYFQGRATAWNSNAYKVLFPDLAPNEKSTQVGHFMDILTEARGGRMTANLITPFVR